MEETVGFDFQANGIRDVLQAFQTVEERMLRAEKVSIESARREAHARLEMARDTSRRQVAAARSAREMISKEESAGLERTAAIARARDEIEKRSADKRKRTELDLYREIEQLQESHTRKTEQETRKRVQLEEEAARKISERHRQFAQRVSGVVGSSVGGSLRQIASYGGMALTMGGALSVGTAAHNLMSAESASIALANSMFNPSDKAQQAWLAQRGQKRFDSKALMSFAGQTEAVTGFDKATLAAGWRDYIGKSSDWQAFATQGGQQRLIDMAKLAKGSGADFGQVMSAAGSLKVQNPNLTDKQMMEMMYAIVGQGKMGAVEMKDLAAHSAVITSTAGSYAGDQRKNQQALLGLSQVAIRTSGSSAEAATAVARFATDVQHHAKDMKKSFGIEAVANEKTGALKKPSEILADLFEKTQGKSSAFGEGKGNVGLGRESVRIANALLPVYSQAVETARSKGTTDEKQLAKIGADAVKKEVQRFENAGYDKKDIEGDFEAVMASTEERFGKVTRNLMQKLEEHLIPVLEKLGNAMEKGAPQIEKLMDSVAKFVMWLAENPYKGIGALIAGKVGIDLTNAAISSVVSKALERVILAAMGESAVGGAATAAAKGAVPGGTGAAGAAGGFGTLGLVGLGAAVQLGSLGTQATELYEWTTGGQDVGKDLAARAAKGDKAAQDRLDKLKGGRSKADTASAYLEQVTRAVSIINPLALAAQYAGDELLEGKGGKSLHRRSLETIRSNEIIDAAQLKKDIAKATFDGFKEGAKLAGQADANDPSRKGPLTSPERK